MVRQLYGSQLINKLFENMEKTLLKIQIYPDKGEDSLDFKEMQLTALKNNGFDTYMIVILILIYFKFAN